MTHTSSLFVATPMYGGQCCSHYATSLLQLGILFTQEEIPFQFYSLSNESLIPRARNTCVEAFLKSEATHLMFIDSDIGFKPEDVLRMMKLMDQDLSYKILGAAYPKKVIAWEKVLLAAHQGKGKISAKNLSRYIGDFVVNFKNETNLDDLHTPCPVGELGTGFMMVRREVFETFACVYPERSYIADNPRSSRFDPNKRIMAYFDCKIDSETGYYLSEDYYFCKEIAKIGYQSWLCPWVELTHVGTYPFESSLKDLIDLGANLRFDPSN